MAGINIKSQPFAYVIRIFAAAVLICGFFTINLLNLFAVDNMYPSGTEVSFTPSSVLSGAAAFATTAVGLFFALRFICACKNKYIGAVLFLLALTLRIAFAAFWKIEPQSDFEITFKLSRLLHETPFFEWGEVLDSAGTVYNNQWSAHMPFVIYQSIFPDYQSIQAANAVFSALTCAFSAGIAKELFGERAGKITFFLSAVNPVSLFFIPVLTNQHAAACFLVAAIWCFYKKPVKKFSIVLCGALTAVSHLLRPEMYAVLIAAAVMCAYSIFKEGAAVRKLADAAVYIAVFFAILFSVDVVLERNEIIHQSMLEGNLKYKIVVGLNEKTGGTWSAEDEQLIYDADALDEVFAERIKSPSVKLMLGKTVYQFGGYVYPWAMSENQVISQLVYRRVGTAFMAVMIIFSVLTLLFKREKRIFPIALILAVYMAVFMIIEIQARYNYFAVWLILILASGVLSDRIRH